MTRRTRESPWDPKAYTNNARQLTKGCWESDSLPKRKIQSLIVQYQVLHPETHVQITLYRMSRFHLGKRIYSHAWV